MAGYDYRQAQQVQDVQYEAPTADHGGGGSNSEYAESLALTPEERESQAIDDVWAWMNEEDAPEAIEVAPAYDACAPSPTFPLDPAQREAQGLPPSGMPGEECVVPVHPVVDPCAPSPILPIDPAQREGQGLPPSGMPGEECVVPAMEADELEAISPSVAAANAADRPDMMDTPFGLVDRNAESMGRSRGGGGDSIRWRTKDPNNPSPYAAPMAQGAPLIPAANSAPMR